MLFEVSETMSESDDYTESSSEFYSGKFVVTYMIPDVEDSSFLHIMKPSSSFSDSIEVHSSTTSVETSTYLTDSSTSSYITDSSDFTSGESHSFSIVNHRINYTVAKRDASFHIAPPPLDSSKITSSIQMTSSNFTWSEYWALMDELEFECTHDSGFYHYRDLLLESAKDNLLRCFRLVGPGKNVYSKDFFLKGGNFTLPVFAIISPENPKYLSGLWIAKRARRRGFGTKICQHLQIERVESPTRDSMEFWTKLGFTESTTTATGKVLYLTKNLNKEIYE